MDPELMNDPSRFQHNASFSPQHSTLTIHPTTTVVSLTTVYVAITSYCPTRIILSLSPQLPTAHTLSGTELHVHF